MNRSKLACDLIADLARLIVGHPAKLQPRNRESGGNTMLFLRAVKSDTGRLIGREGAIHKAMQEIGNDIALTPFEVIVEDATEDAPLVNVKPWQCNQIQEVLRKILEAVFNRDFLIMFHDEGSTLMVNIEVGNGFEPERIARVSEKLKLVFNAIGRAHNRNIRIWLAEAKAVKCQ